MNVNRIQNQWHEYLRQRFERIQNDAVREPNIRFVFWHVLQFPSAFLVLANPISYPGG